MNLISLFEQDCKKNKKSEMAERSRTAFAFKTGVDLLDYKNGQAIFPGEGKPYPSLGISEGTYVMWIGNSGTGKAQPLDSIVFTKNGPMLMGDIKVGTEVVTPKNKLAKVVGVFPQGKIDCFRINLSDGSSMRCNDSHLMKVYHKDIYDRDVYEIKTLKEISKDFIDENGVEKYYVPYTEPVDFTSRKTLVEPTLFGLLKASNIHITENGIVVNDISAPVIERHCYNLGLKTRISSDKETLIIVSPELARDFKREEVHSFIFNSISTRVRFLKGVFGVNGDFDRLRKLVFNDEKETIMIECAIRSLGGTCDVKFRGFEATYELCNIKFPPAILKYFTNLITGSDLITYERTIESIEVLPQTEMQCIMLDDEDHLYLTNDFIVTHNTTLAMQAAYNIIKPYEQASIFHFDIENGFSKTRFKKLVGCTTEELQKKYFHKNSGITSESFYNTIRSLSRLKKENKEEFMVNTGKIDEDGNEIQCYAPTVVVLDSLPMLVPEKISEEDELGGQMSQTAVAKANASIFRRILPILKETNIILFVINHITQKVEINPMMHSKPQINFLKQGEELPGESYCLAY